MKVTIRKIAEESGVSRGTVDKVVHGRPGVSDEVRARVQAVIDSHGYAPRHRKKQEEPELRHYIVSVILPRLTNPFFVNVKHGIDEMQKMLPGAQISTEYFFCDSANIPEILSVLDYVEERGVDGIILRGVQSRRLRDRLNALHENKIPVVLLDADVPEAKRLCLVGEDSRTSGRVAASLLAKSIGGAGEIAVIGGFQNITTHRVRLLGFEEVIRERFPEIRIVDVVNCHDQSVIAYEETLRLMQKYPNLKGIFSAVGCAGDIGQALIEAQHRQIKMVSYNFTPDIIALVKRGIIDFTIGLTPSQQGATALRVLADFLLSNQKPAREFLEMPIIIGVDENVEVLSQSQMI
ncbi:MAG: LacI family DNA-binding transcriptional regulator [Butyricicoccaceae bacterium]